MKRIEVKKGTTIENIKSVVASVLENEEVITNDIYGINMAARGVAAGTGLGAGMTSYDGYALEYRLILTNKRVLLVGEVGHLNLLTGISSIDFNEIKAIKVDNEDTPNNVIIELDDKYYTLSLTPEEKNIKAIKALEAKVTNKDHKYKTSVKENVLIAFAAGLGILLVFEVIKSVFGII